MFYLGEVGLLKLLIGPNVLREIEEVVRRKAAPSLPTLAQLLDSGRVEITPAPQKSQLEVARSIVRNEPDAYVLADALCAKADWFITHDKNHFLQSPLTATLPFQVGTPGDLIQSLKDDFAG